MHNRFHDHFRLQFLRTSALQNVSSGSGEGCRKGDEGWRARFTHEDYAYSASRLPNREEKTDCFAVYDHLVAIYLFINVFVRLFIKFFTCNHSLGEAKN